MELTYRIDCRELTSRAAAHDCFARVFSLPASYGRNLDALYDVLDDATRRFLLNEIKAFGNSMYMHDINRLENHIADNHVWQMTFRILTMAAFTVYGELPEADAWTDYCYNLWLARFPGLNKDGAWHNGDSYFHVNIRTLVEVPYFYTRLTGFNYFSCLLYTSPSPRD